MTVADHDGSRKELASAIESVLGWSEGELHDLARLTGGASRETWSFGGPGDQRLILQRERPGAAHPGAGMSAEARVLRSAASAGVPVPEVIATDADRHDRGDGVADSAAPLGSAWIISRAVAGETIARRLLRDVEFDAVRPTLARRCGEVLAAIHAVPVHELAHVLDATDQVEQFREVARSLMAMLGDQRPTFELGFRWLERNRPSPRPPALVHGDFRNGNLVVDRTGLAAVLDWELAHLGNPMEDLGWFCVRAWRFGSAHRAGGFGPVEELLEGYEQGGGHPPTVDELRWWEALGTLKWGVMCMIQAATHLGGATRSVELATIGRRTAENEWDLLELIAPTPVADDDPRSSAGGDESSAQPRTDSTSGPPVGAAGLHGRPSAAELVEAVREFLERDVMSATTGRTSFHSRVAANALAIVQRELEAGDAPQRRHVAELESRGWGDDVSLGSAIAAGDLDDRFAEVASVLRGAVADRLRIANPRYTAET